MSMATPYHLEVLLMENGELMCGRQSLGFLKNSEIEPYLRHCDCIQEQVEAPDIE